MAQEYTTVSLYHTWPPTSYTTTFWNHYFQPRPLSCFSSTYSVLPLSLQPGCLTSPSHSEIQKYISQFLSLLSALATLTVWFLVFGASYHCLPSQSANLDTSDLPPHEHQNRQRGPSIYLLDVSCFSPLSSPIPAAMIQALTISLLEPRTLPLFSLSLQCPQICSPRGSAFIVLHAKFILSPSAFHSW